MGISANQFWASSKNGKAMVVMLAERGDVELCKDICEWLVGEKRKAIAADARRGGKSEEAARIIAQQACEGLTRAAESIDDRNCETQSSSIIDALYARHYAAGKGVYDKAMADLADVLRHKVTD